MKNKTMKNHVSVEQGNNKYILLAQKDRYSVISKDLKYHMDIFESLEDVISANTRVQGGGVINYDEENKEIVVTNTSGSYGKADHELTKTILQEAFGPEYTIITELDIEKKEKKDREEMLAQVRDEMGTEMIDLIKSLSKDNQINFYKKIDKIEMLEKDVLENYLLDLAKYEHIRGAEDIDFIINSLDKSGLIYENTSSFSGNIMDRIVTRCADFNYPLDKIADALNKSPLSKEGTRVQKCMQKIIRDKVFEADSHYEGYKAAILDSINYTNKSFTTSLIHSGAEEVVKKKDFQGFSEDYKSFLQEHSFKTDVVDKEAEDYVFKYLDWHCDLRVEFLKSLADMVNHFGMEKQPIKNEVLNQIKKRINANYDGDGAYSGLRYIKNLADIFEIPSEDYKQDILDSIENRNLESLKSGHYDIFLAMESVLSMGDEVDSMFEKAFAEEIKSGKNVFDYLVKLTDEQYNKNHLSNTAIKNIVEAVIESDEISRHIKTDTEGILYQSVLKLKSSLNKRKIELDKDILNEEQKEAIYDSASRKAQEKSYYAKSAFNFAKEFLDTEKIHESAINYFDSYKDGYFGDILTNSGFIKDNDLDTSRFTNSAEQAYEHMKEELEEIESNNAHFGESRLWGCYEKLGKFARDMDLSQQWVDESFDKSFNGFMKLGSISDAYRIAKDIDHPMKNNLKKIYDVIG